MNTMMQSETKNAVSAMLDATLDEMEQLPQRRQLESTADALAFILAGKAIFTLKSKATGTRYTYRVSRAKDKQDLFFVSVLSGPDNTSDYNYIGVISNRVFRLTQKSSMNRTSKPIIAIDFAVRHLAAGNLPEQLEIWHEGRCGLCGRKLTVPESIERGIGPECASK